MELINVINIDDFLKYKDAPENQEVLLELRDFCFKNKNSNNRTTLWRKPEIKPTENWLLSKKLNQSDDERLYSQIRSILNKISESNLLELSKELTSLEISKQVHLTKLVEFIFNKAILENKFSSTYAKLSKELISYYILDETGKNIYFRELLINTCQLSFYEVISHEQESINTGIKSKESILGCMNFIGELYNNDLLTSKIINSCFLVMLMKLGPTKQYLIDCICSLMRIVGKSFYSKCKNETNNIFDKLKNVLDESKQLGLSKKDEFNIIDILELRIKEKW